MRYTTPKVRIPAAGLIFYVALTCAAAGCGAEERRPGTGSTLVDAGTQADVGVVADSGELVDAGPARDAGSPANQDAGPADSGMPAPDRYGLCDGSCTATLCIIAPDPSAPTGRACAPDCTTTAGCPAPTDGTAVPQCTASPSLCVLTCDAAESCPTGMACQSTQFPGLNRICVWPE